MRATDTVRDAFRNWTDDVGRRVDTLRENGVSRRALVKWAAIGIGVLWFAVMGLNQITQPLPYDMRSSQVERRQERCSGSFSDRYECRSAVLIGTENRLFFIWMKRLGIIFVPLLLLNLSYKQAIRREWI